MARRKRTWLVITPILIILGVILVLGLIAGYNSNAQIAKQHEEAQAKAALQQELAAQQKEQEERDAAKYDRIMTALKISSYVCPDSASKAVTLKIIPGEIPSGIFTKEYLPNDHTTDDPAEVRYIIRCTANKKVYGEYVSGGIAYQYSYDVQIVDLLSSQIIAEKSFLGSTPPFSVPANSGDHCGNPPRSETIQAWIASVLSPA